MSYPTPVEQEIKIEAARIAADADRGRRMKLDRVAGKLAKISHLSVQPYGLHIGEVDKLFAILVDAIGDDAIKREVDRITGAKR